MFNLENETLSGKHQKSFIKLKGAIKDNDQLFSLLI